MAHLSRRARLAALVLGGLVFSGGAAGAQERAVPPPIGATLLDRTLATVGGAIVTASDVALARALGLVEGEAAATPATALAALVDRWLMLHEVARFSPAEPAPAAVAVRLAAIRAHTADSAAVAARLTEAGRTPAYLESWARDDLRLAAYLEQRFASAGAPAESDVDAYVAAHVDELAQAGLTGAGATTAARARLVEERRRDLIADWLIDLRRRTTVVTFPPAAP